MGNFKVECDFILKEIKNKVKDIEIWSNVKRKKGKYTIMTINTARNMLPLLAEKDFMTGRHILLILDEVHNYGSPANSHIFDFIGKGNTVVFRSSACRTGNYFDVIFV